MTDPRFHPRPDPLDLDRLLALTGATLKGGPRALSIAGVAAIDWAGPGDLVVATCAKEAGELAESDAGACLTTPDLSGFAPDRMAALATPDPQTAFARVAATLFPASGAARPLFGRGIAPSATIHPEARLETDVSVDAGAVVGPRAEIGRGATIGANAVVGADVRIGRDSVIGPGCVVEHALIGDRVTLQAGVRIGPGGAGRLGRAIVQDDVEIGAGAAVERGAARDTIVGEASRLGAFARVGPDAVLGRLCVVSPRANVADGAVFADGAVIGLDSAP